MIFCELKRWNFVVEFVEELLFDTVWLCIWRFDLFFITISLSFETRFVWLTLIHNRVKAYHLYIFPQYLFHL